MLDSHRRGGCEDRSLLDTYYFITPSEFELAVNSDGVSWFAKSSKNDNENRCAFIMEYEIIKNIKPRFINAEQSPTFIETVRVINNNVEIVLYKSRPPNLRDNMLYINETLYRAEYELDKLIISDINNPQYKKCDPVYTIDITPFKREDGQMPLFYTRGDLIYAIQGYMNIKTGEFTAAPNPTLEYDARLVKKFWVRKCSTASFDFIINDDEKCEYVVGQYFVTYNPIYRGPVEIEGFRAIVNGNISIYEYAGVSKVKIPTRTKPALHED
jgi:hypothetical protein